MNNNTSEKLPMDEKTKYEEKYLKYKARYENLLKSNSYPSHDDGDGDEKVKHHLGLLEMFAMEGYNKRDWDMVKQIYDKNTLLTFSTGQQVRGINKILDTMKQGISDDKVESHAIQFGSGDWTATDMIMTGTFTKPFKNPDGTVVQPNGKKWIMHNCVLTRWCNDKIIDAVGFWDTGALMRQLNA